MSVATYSCTSSKVKSCGKSFCVALRLVMLIFTLSINHSNNFMRLFINFNGTNCVLMFSLAICLSGEVEVQIRVTDKNDERPYFKKNLYTASVPENADPGSVIITVTAEDKDEGYCNRRTY